MIYDSVLHVHCSDFTSKRFLIEWISRTGACVCINGQL